jgi:hypothetical protein
MKLSRLLQELTIDDYPIADVDDYNKGMKSGMGDKEFFLDHIHPDLIVDFGCADGVLLGDIHARHPEIDLVGYDISAAMEKKFKDNNPDLTFTTNWNEAKHAISGHHKSCLLLSSVIHEVYSYSRPKQIKSFWNEVFNSGFKYITIRDTIPKGIDQIKNYKDDVNAVKKIVDPHLLKDYETKWGPLESSYRNFVRFLMVYRYKNNWARESLENYMPLTYNTLIRKIPETYEVVYDKSFVYDPIEKSINSDYNVSIQKDTHLKMILEKR